jgi:hypothetical protein
LLIGVPLQAGSPFRKTERGRPSLLAATEVVHPNNLVWVVVGDRAKIEAGVRELGLGEVQILNPE